MCILILIMPNATIYIQKENMDTWGKIPGKSDFINKVLQQLAEEWEEQERKDAEAEKERIAKQNEQNGGQNEVTKELPNQKASKKIS